MIPKKAIEKAIEGGYGEYGTVWWDEVLGPVIPLRDGGNAVGWMHAALDPEFWQSLGKALVWGDCICKGCGKAYPEYVNGCVVPHSGERSVRADPHYLHHTGIFIRLVLTEGDTQKFWDELLSV
jgi:hypothetical protein